MIECFMANSEVENRIGSSLEPVSGEQDHTIIDACAKAIAASSAPSWHPDAQKLLSRELYEKLAKVKARHPDWKILVHDAIDELAVDYPSRKKNTIDIFEDVKSQLMELGVSRSGLHVVGRVFGQSLVILQTGRTTTQLQDEREKYGKKPFVSIPVSASKSERKVDPRYFVNDMYRGKR
jgi:hypothetical protein